MSFVAGFVSAIVSWAICAFLFIPHGEDFTGLGQMLFMGAAALAWVPLWTCMVMLLLRDLPAVDLQNGDPHPQSLKDDKSFLIPLGGVAGLMVLIVVAKIVEESRYGKRAVALAVLIIPAAAIGALIGARFARSKTDR